MLPATFEGRWIRLRPISRKDHPLIFALRLKTAGSERQDLSIPAPTFDDWESRELADLLSSGPAFVVETRDEEFCGIARMSRVNVRDGWSYIGVRLYPDLLNTALSLEALWALVTFAFSQFNLRKLYAETSSAQDQMISDFGCVGFLEETRLTERVWFAGHYFDLIYMSLSRGHWDDIASRRIAGRLASRAAGQ